MYFNSGYLNNSRLDFKDNTRPLVVGSYGTYRLKTRPTLPKGSAGLSDFVCGIWQSTLLVQWCGRSDHFRPHGSLPAERDSEIHLLCRRPS